MSTCVCTFLAILMKRLIIPHFQATYDEFRKQDKKDKDNKGANSQSHKQARYCEAGDSVMKPIMELISPLNQNKVWDDIRYRSLLFLALSHHEIRTMLWAVQV